MTCFDQQPTRYQLWLDRVFLFSFFFSNVKTADDMWLQNGKLNKDARAANLTLAKAIGIPVVSKVEHKRLFFISLLLFFFDNILSKLMLRQMNALWSNIRLSPFDGRFTNVKSVTCAPDDSSLTSTDVIGNHSPQLTLRHAFSLSFAALRQVIGIITLHVHPLQLPPVLVYLGRCRAPVLPVGFFFL